MTIEKVKKRLLATVSLHHAFNDGSSVTLPAIFPILYKKQLLILNYSAIGNIILSGMIVAIAAQALVGHYVRPRHSRYFLALDALIVGVSLLLMTLAANFGMLVLFFIGMRIGTSIYHPVGISWVSHSFRGKALDRAMGTQSAFGNIGVLLAFTSTGFLAHTFGWKMPLYIWGTANLLAVPVGLLLSRGTVSSVDIAEQKEVEKNPASWFLAFRQLGIFIPLTLLGGLAWGIMIYYSPSLLNHKLSLSMSHTGMILGYWMSAGTIAALLYGKITSLIGRCKTVLTSITAIALGAFILAYGTNLAAVITAFVLLGLALFTIYPATISFISSTVGERNRTVGFAINANIAIIGNSVFAKISGNISDSFGIQSPFILLGAASISMILYMSYIIKSGRVCPD
ncbi:MAG: MFS transporter [Candidatus Krumholzibacteriota bacterium]|nr:MFS transporter [Candidatus Krumholzibacteriota bacterium]